MQIDEKTGEVRPDELVLPPVPSGPDMARVQAVCEAVAASLLDPSKPLSEVPERLVQILAFADLFNSWVSYLRKGIHQRMRERQAREIGTKGAARIMLKTVRSYRWDEAAIKKGLLELLDKPDGVTMAEMEKLIVVTTSFDKRVANEMVKRGGEVKRVIESAITTVESDQLEIEKGGPKK